MSESEKGGDAAFDYSGYVDEEVSDGELGQLSNLAELARQAEYEVEEAQRTLKTKQDAHRDLVEHKIPELMDKVGMEKFSTKGGLNIAIKEAIRASMGSGEEKERNIKWLEDNGHEAIVKMTVSTPFGRGIENREKAKALADELNNRGFEASFERKVEPSTLSSLVRELLEGGMPVPEESLHVHRQRTAKIT